MYEKKNSWCYFDDNHKEKIKNARISATVGRELKIEFTTRTGEYMYQKYCYDGIMARMQIIPIFYKKDMFGEYKVYDGIRAVYLKTTKKDWDNEKRQHINGN